MFKHNWAWIKLANDNFSTVLTRNLRNPRDYAPLKDFPQRGKMSLILANTVQCIFLNLHVYLKK